MPTPSAFGAMLKQRRRQLRLSQDALAEIVSVVRITIAKYEAGERCPSPEIAARLADALEIRDEARAIFLRLAAQRGGPLRLGPPPLTPLIGRADELAELRKLIARPAVRLVTLKGPPGVGKTRLALALAPDLREQFADGIVRVDLATVQQPDQVFAEITKKLDLRPITANDPQSQAQDLHIALREKQILLILDGIEHLTAIGPDLQKLLQACPRLKILATTRRELQISVEHVVPILPLALPDPARPLTSEAALESPAVALFVERATAARADFTLTEADLPTVVAICAALDGIPLAIQLIAARVRHFDPQELCDLLAQPLDLLSAGPQDLAEHHQSLRQTLALSYRLLVPSEQALFRRLGIFVGSFPLTAAAAVAGDLLPAAGGVLPILDRLIALVDHSLLQRADDQADDRRFMMLNIVRAFAREQLGVTQELDATEQQKTAYHLQFAEEASAGLRGPDRDQWMERLTQSFPDLQATLSWLQSRQLTADTAQICTLLAEFWHRSGHWHDIRHRLTWLLQHEHDLPQPLLAQTIRQAGLIARRQGDYAQAQALLDRYLGYARDQGEAHNIAFTLNILGVIAMNLGAYPAAEGHFTESLRLWREEDSPRNIAAVLENLAILAGNQGAYDQADELHQQALSSYQVLPDRAGVCRVLCNQGRSVLHQGDHPRAHSLLEESLALAIELNAPDLRAAITNNLGLCLAFQGRLTEAAAYLRENLVRCRELGDKRAIAYGLEGMASIAAFHGQPLRAARLFGAAVALRKQIRAILAQAEQAMYAQVEDDARSSAGSAAYDAARKRGSSLPWDAAITEALAIRA